MDSIEQQICIAGRKIEPINASGRHLKHEFNFRYCVLGCVPNSTKPFTCLSTSL